MPAGTPGLFEDRRDAGRRLAGRLGAYAGRADVLVLALPRGGVPVGFEVARALDAPLDVFLVRKLGLPGHEELAMGAVASGGVRVLNEEVVERLGVPAAVIEKVAARENSELARRERSYREGRPPPEVRGRTVILVDDGLATGATMSAAIAALRQQGPAAIVVAVPTAAPDTCEEMRAKVDEVVCAITPEPFYAVGLWYRNFEQTSDEEVRALLAAVGEPAPAKAAGNPGPDAAVATLRAAVVPLAGSARDYDALLDAIGEARFVLLGEASHGTHEFYRERACITRRLVAEKGFMAVAVEADWPDALRLDRWLRGRGRDVDAAEALADFRRFPTWMWRNTDVVEFAEWLRGHNEALPPAAPAVGWYGLDLYSLHTSMKAVLRYLDKVDPRAAREARARYACFERFDDEQVYGFMTNLGLAEACTEEVVAQLVELQRKAAEYAGHDAGDGETALFHAEQNARLVRNAEAYYRSMYLAEVSSWNLRDSHMAETLDALVRHLERDGRGPAKIVVWAHNSHLGDARATRMGERGELNLGQLVRERHGRDAFLVGFTTWRGTVTAAADWGAKPEQMRVRTARHDSYEALFHAVGEPRFMIIWRGHDAAAEALRGPRLERAIGVIYRPETELQSHYFWARLPEQFDAVLHFDETRAVTPLEYGAEWEPGEVPETYPTAV